MGVHAKLTGAERAARWRAKKRAQGLRPRTIWVPDVRNPEVRAKIERAVAAINASDSRDGVMDWIESINAEVEASLPPYDWGEEGPPGEEGGATK